MEDISGYDDDGIVSKAIIHYPAQLQCELTVFAEYFPPIPHSPFPFMSHLKQPFTR